MAESKRFSTTHILLVTVLILIFIPISFPDVRLFGIVLTPERVLVSLIALLAVINYFSFRVEKKVDKLLWMTFLILLVITGIILLLTSGYVSRGDGLKELLGLVIALLSTFIMMTLFENEKLINASLTVVKWILAVCVIVALIEIVFDVHLPSSYYSIAVGNLQLGGATGFYYGINDFSAFITVLCPAFLYRNHTRLKKVCSAIFLVLIFLINICNNARLCIIAMVAGAAVAIIIWKRIKMQTILKVLLFVGLAGLILLFAYEVLGLKISIVDKVLDKIYHEIAVFTGGTGSISLRSTIYMDTISASAKNWFFGYGPNSFGNYFSINPSGSKLINPHSMFLEVMFNYGLVFALGLLYFIVKIIRNNIKQYKESSNIANLIAATIMVIYIFASFAPSSFLNYSYQWYCFAFGISLLTKGTRSKEIEQGNCEKTVFLKRAGSI